jgi:hypothetical protein
MYRGSCWLKLELLNQLICDAVGPFMLGMVLNGSDASRVLPKLHLVAILRRWDESVGCWVEVGKMCRRLNQ